MGIIKNLKEEVRIIKERDPAIHSSMEVLLYPSFKVMIHYRLAHKLYVSGHYFWARYISQRGVRKTGIEIHPGAQIGKGFFIDHGNGVIIGETTIIGDNVTLYQGVTLGGTGKEHGPLSVKDLPRHMTGNENEELFFPDDGINYERPLKDIMADIERGILRKALKVHGSVQKVAEVFKVNRSTIFRKLHSEKDGGE